MPSVVSSPHPPQDHPLNVLVVLRPGTFEPLNSLEFVSERSFEKFTCRAWTNCPGAPVLCKGWVISPAHWGHRRVDTFLGRALTDAATGLPNVPYFRIIQNWEERRARRRKTLVRVIRVAVEGGAEGSRRALLWRLCQELRTSDLIASEGRDTFHILLTTPDAENAVAIAERVQHVGDALREVDRNDPSPLVLRTEIEPPPQYVAEKGPCDPCEEHELIKQPSSSAAASHDGELGPGRPAS